jgi:hypothetical protein
MKSVIEYFQEVYGFTIQYPHLPCLQVGSQKKVNYLPMEVCDQYSNSLFLFKHFLSICKALPSI